jgi:hypothetical protein
VEGAAVEEAAEEEEEEEEEDLHLEYHSQSEWWDNPEK